MKDMYLLHKTIEQEIREMGLGLGERSVFIKFGQLFKQRRLRNALISTSVVNLAQQLCGSKFTIYRYHVARIGRKLTLGKVNVAAFYSETFFISVLSGDESAPLRYTSIRAAMVFSFGFVRCTAQIKLRFDTETDMATFARSRQFLLWPPGYQDYRHIRHTQVVNMDATPYVLLHVRWGDVIPNTVEYQKHRLQYCAHGGAVALFSCRGLFARSRCAITSLFLLRCRLIMHRTNTLHLGVRKVSYGLDSKEMVLFTNSGSLVSRFPTVRL